MSPSTCNWITKRSQTESHMILLLTDMCDLHWNLDGDLQCSDGAWRRISGSRTDHHDLVHRWRRCLHNILQPFQQDYTHREQTLLQCLNSHYYSRHAELWRLTWKGKLLVIGHLSFDGPPFAAEPLRRANAAPASSQNVPINVILILHIQLGYPAHTESRLMIRI